MDKSPTARARFAAFLLPTAENIDSKWLSKLMPPALLKMAKGSRQGSRLLTRELYRRYRIVPPAQADLQPHQQWVLAHNTVQRRLAHRLGCLACAEFIRTSVRKDAVKQLRGALGDEQYRALLIEISPVVEGLAREAFENALAKAQLHPFLVAVGMALLELTLEGDDPFFKLRMKFTFPPLCWRLRPRELSMDRRELATLIDKIVDATPEAAP